MILIFRKDATEEQIQSALRKIEALGYTPHLSRGSPEDHLRRDR